MKGFGMFKRIAGLILPVLLIVPAYASIFTDNFDSGINSYYWSIVLENPSNTVVWDSGRVVMTQAAAAPPQYYYSGSNLRFNFNISGDFVSTVDFTLLYWPSPYSPSTNQERAGIRTNWGAVERISDNNYYDGKTGELYVTDFTGHINTLNTSETSGSLKLTRTGNLVEGYYFTGSTWVSIGSYTLANTPTDYIELSIWPNVPTAGVQVAFDNFYLETQSDIPAVPVPAAAWLLGSGLVGLVALKRRKLK